MSTIGERIKTARLDRGINQRRLCELANITETTLSRYENGTREPQAANIGKIARVLNVSTDYLIGTNDDNIPDILKFPLRSDSYVDSVQYKISETIKYNYIKNLVTELKNNYGKDVYIRGLIEFTNYCKNDCLYCGIRKSNRNADRYRLTKEDLADLEGFTVYPRNSRYILELREKINQRIKEFMVR